jgi:hypothetical protein
MMFYSFHWKIPKAQACGARQPVYRLGFLVPPAGNGGGSVEARPRLALAFWVCVVVGGGGHGCKRRGFRRWKSYTAPIKAHLV